jgi:predicted alpha/beta superfamily hydrolase
MKGSIEKFTIQGYECLLYLPPEYETSIAAYPVLYFNGEEEVAKLMEAIEPYFEVSCETFLLISVLSNNWKDDYSPWPATALVKKEEAFGGGAAAYLNFLSDVVKPYIDGHYRTKKQRESTTLMGYSLGGLVAAYAIYVSNAFGKIGSLSGSLWFDGWLEFMEANFPGNVEAKVYFSLGRGEERSRNQKLAKVGHCTQKAAEILKQQLKSKDQVILEWNHGGHFTETLRRYEKAILWLMKI